MNRILYFTENFFSSGKTEIFNGAKEKVGELDLKSMFSSGVDVLDLEGNVLVSGKFPFLSSKWKIYNQQGQEIGSLKGKFAFFSEKYEYEAFGRNKYEIKSPAFSKHYEIFLDEATPVCKFEKVSGFFSTPAYQFQSFTDVLSPEELITIVMGVYAIQRRRNSAGTAATT